MKSSLYKALLLCGCMTAAALLPLSAQTEMKNTISVTGNGAVKATPDSAVIRLAVITSDQNAAKAAAKNAELMVKVQNALTATGIAKEDISTANYNIYQEYSAEKDSRGETKSYRASNNLSVLIRQLDKTGAAIDAALSAGANQFSGIQFICSTTQDMTDQARQIAVQDARLTAEKLAKAAGRTLGKAIIIRQTGSDAPVYYEAAGLDNAKHTMLATTPIQAGSSDITASVQIVYELK